MYNSLDNVFKQIISYFKKEDEEGIVSSLELLLTLKETISLKSIHFELTPYDGDERDAIIDVEEGILTGKYFDLVAKNDALKDLELFKARFKKINGYFTHERIKYAGDLESLILMPSFLYYYMQILSKHFDFIKPIGEIVL